MFASSLYVLLAFLELEIHTHTHQAALELTEIACFRLLSARIKDVLPSLPSDLGIPKPTYGLGMVPHVFNPST